MDVGLVLFQFAEVSTTGLNPSYHTFDVMIVPAEIVTPLYCPKITHKFLNGKMKIEGNKAGDKVYYFCSKGYYLVGPSYQTCLAKTCKWRRQDSHQCKCE